MVDIELVVEADEPALFCSSVSGAEAYLEAIDVRDGVYRAAYGPDGQPFDIRAAGERVMITPALRGTEPDKLRALLLRFLESTNDKNIGPDVDLPVLRARCGYAAI
jgi:hypothetical protein